MTINDKSAAHHRASQQTRPQLPDHPFPPLDRAVSQDSSKTVYRYGRLIADIYKIYSKKWQFHRDSNIPNLTRDISNKFKIVFACPENLQDEDKLRMAVDAAVRELNPDKHTCFLKLYLNMPKNIEHMKRRFVWKIAEKNYWVLLFFSSYRGILPLNESYELFLSKLGQNTRGKMRKARRNAIRSGLTHQMEHIQPNLSPERETLAKEAYPVAFKPKAVAALDRVIRIQARSFQSSLRLQSGEIISSCSGFIEDDTAFLIYQMNHRGYLKYSLSMTHVAILVENFIQTGIKNIYFVYGYEGLLSHVCIDESGMNILVIRRSFLGLLSVLIYIFQFPVSVLLKRLSDKLKKLTTHIVRPFRPQPKTNNAQ
jgi:hypothetical protein